MNDTLLCYIDCGPENLKGPYQKGYMNSLGYLHWHEVAEYRYKHKDPQLYCVTCGRWQWPEECEHEKMRPREGNAYLRAAAKAAKAMKAGAK
jgi:hypothetical protein